jgi:hypothetical protein
MVLLNLTELDIELLMNIKSKSKIIGVISNIIR